MSILSFFKRKITRPPVSKWDTGAGLSFFNLQQGDLIATSNMSVEDLLSNDTVSSCVNIISDAVAVLPLNVFRKTGEGRKKQEGALQNLFHTRFDSETLAFTAKKQIMMHLLLRGNAFLFIQRDTQTGKVAGLTPLDPDKMEICRDTDTLEIYFKYTLDGIVHKYTKDNILHIPAARYRGLWGLSPLQYSFATGEGITLGRYTRAQFDGGIHSKLLVTVPYEWRNWSKDDAVDLKQRLLQAYGGRENAQSPLILSKGMTASPLQLPNNEDSQLLEARKFSQSQIAMIYRVPLSMLGQSDAKYNNNEQQAQGFLQNTLNPWLCLLQESFSSIIGKQAGGGAGNLYVEFDTNAMIRADMQKRMMSYQIGLTNGIYSLNDICQMENRPLLDKDIGDVRFFPCNMRPLTKENLSNNPIDNAKDTGDKKDEEGKEDDKEEGKEEDDKDK